MSGECARCGKAPVRVIVGGEALCGDHSLAWLTDESAAAQEVQVQRVADALDVVLDQPITDDWDAHVRKLALAAIGAM